MGIYSSHCLISSTAENCFALSYLLYLSICTSCFIFDKKKYDLTIIQRHANNSLPKLSHNIKAKRHKILEYAPLRK